jgi:hypothetical protein
MFTPKFLTAGVLGLGLLAARMETSDDRLAIEWKAKQLGSLEYL